MQKIKSIAELQSIIGRRFMEKIILNHQAGDPDWLIDMTSELDYIKPNAGFFIKGFHGKLLDKGYGTKDINAQRIYTEIETWKPAPGREKSWIQRRRKLDKELDQISKAKISLK